MKRRKDICGEDSYFTTRSMDVYITKLRKYFAADEGVLAEKLPASGCRMLVSRGRRIIRIGNLHYHKSDSLMA